MLFDFAAQISSTLWESLATEERRCAGVIVESEDLHREAYNAAFAHFKACIGGKQDVIDWSEEFYDDLQNKVGGGKAKMRWYFGTAPFWWLAWSCCIAGQTAR